MMSNILPFDFHGRNVRAIPEENPLFCAKDVCDVLGYRNDTDAIKKHCRPDGVVKRYSIDSTGRNQLTAFITEGNLYRLIVKSRLPAAERFEQWVMDEVLPTLRKTGSYGPQLPGPALALAQILEHHESSIVDRFLGEREDMRCQIDTLRERLELLTEQVSGLSAEQVSALPAKKALPRPDSRVAQCARWLSSLLAGRTIRATIGISLAAQAGFSKNTLERAKHQLGVVSYREGSPAGRGAGAWYWRLGRKPALPASATRAQVRHAAAEASRRTRVFRGAILSRAYRELERRNHLDLAAEAARENLKQIDVIEQRGLLAELLRIVRQAGG